MIRLSLSGHALVLGIATSALFLATEMVVPLARHLTESYGTQVPACFIPALYGFNFCAWLVIPVAVAGSLLLVVGLIGRGPVRLLSFCRSALAVLSGLIACLSLYLLASGGIGLKLALGDQRQETYFYKRVLKQFSLLQAAEGRYEKFKEVMLRDRNMKMVEVRSVSEFSKAEVDEQISSLLKLLPTAEARDLPIKRQILATLCLFQDRVGSRSFEHQARDLPRLAAEAGAPSTNSPAETLQWIAGNLHKDGWEPLPLFRWSWAP